MEKPDIKIEGDKISIKQNVVAIDLDGDGAKSVVIGVFAEGDKAELAQEILAKIMAQNGLPDWFKGAIGLK